MGREIQGISDDALASLVEYEYPGNVRELENIVEHACVLCRKDYIFPEHLPASVRGRSDTAGALRRGVTLKELERLAIRDALRRNRGSRRRTAEELGIDPSTLYRKMRAYGIRDSEPESR